MNKNVIHFFKISLLSGLLIFTAACKKTDEPEPEEVIDPSGKLYHVALAVDPEGQSATYFQQVSNLETGTISFDNKGYQLHSTRTARPFPSRDGRNIYSLDYGGGQIYSYRAHGGDDYSVLDQINVQFVMGTANPRWTMIDPDYALLHNVTSDATTVIRDGDGAFVKRKVTARLARIGLGQSLSMTSNEEFELLLNELEAREGVYVSRIDAPAVSNGKAYYGFARSKVDVNDPSVSVPYTYTDAQSFVVDYPSLKNFKLIKTNKAAGATNGYRTPVAHVNEEGDVYQMVSSSGQDTKILKLRNGAYDESYEFNLSQLIGRNTASNGWFYVGNGIGYMPFVDTDLGPASSANWYVARIDLKNNKAVVLNLPTGLWLQQYQYSVMKDGKLVMALHPKEGNGNIYFMDPASESPNGFEKGAAINVSAGRCYIGVF